MKNLKKIILSTILLASMSMYSQKKYSLYGESSLVGFKQLNINLDGRYEFSPKLSLSSWSQRTNGIEQAQGGDYFVSINTFNYKMSVKSTVSLGVSNFRNKNVSRDQFIIRLRLKLL
jgi:outer membrane receptor for ferrienterochelin and colicin